MLDHVKETETHFEKNDGEIAKVFEDIQEIHFKLQNKTDKIWSDKMKESIKRCALYEDYKELYNKTMIPMKKFTDDIMKYKEEHT